MVKSNLVDVVAQVGSSLVGRTCYFCLQIYLARTLGPRDFGVFALGLTVLTLMSGIAPFGMPQAIVRFEISGRKALSSMPLLVASVIGLVLFLSVAASAQQIASIFKENQSAGVMLVMAPSILLLCIFGVLCSALRVAGRNVASAVLDAFFFILYLGATLLAFRFGTRSPQTVALSYDLALATTAIVACAFCLGSPGRSSTVTMRSLISFGFVTMIIHAVSMLNLQVDRLIIGVYAGGREVGLYQVATQIAMAAIVLRVAVLRVFEARIPKTGYALRADLTREFVASTRILIHISAPGLVCVALTGSFWTQRLFGDAYVAAAAPLGILVLGQLIQSFTGPSITALHMTGEERTAMSITIGAFAFNTLGNFALFPFFGLMGSAIATGAASVVLGFASFARLRASGRLAPVSYALIDVVIGTFAAAVPPILAAELGFSSVPSMLLVGVLSYVSYISTVSLFRKVEDEAFDLAFSMVRKAFKWREHTCGVRQGHFAGSKMPVHAVVVGLPGPASESRKEEMRSAESFGPSI